MEIKVEDIKKELAKYPYDKKTFAWTLKNAAVEYWHILYSLKEKKHVPVYLGEPVAQTITIYRFPHSDNPLGIVVDKDVLYKSKEEDQQAADKLNLKNAVVGKTYK